MNNDIARAWFDQFTPEVLDAMAVQGNGQWCARHWAPCPVLDGNGLKAAVIIAQAARQEQLSSETPWCCQIGDLGMWFLWDACPPPPDGRYA